MASLCLCNSKEECLEEWCRQQGQWDLTDKLLFLGSLSSKAIIVLLSQACTSNNPHLDTSSPTTTIKASLSHRETHITIIIAHQIKAMHLPQHSDRVWQ